MCNDNYRAISAIDSSSLRERTDERVITIFHLARCAERSEDESSGLSDSFRLESCMLLAAAHQDVNYGHYGRRLATR